MQYIALKSANENLVGAIVYWRLVNDTNGDDLNDALRTIGLDDEDLVSMPTPRAALRRTIREQSDRTTFQRAHRGAHLLVRQRPDEDTEAKVDFDVAIEARLSVLGTPKIRIFDEEGIEVQDTVQEGEMLDRFWHNVYHLSTTDLSSWLISQAGKCDALSLRNTGGIYFIPRHKIDEWQKRVDAVQSSTGCSVYQIPSMHMDDAVNAVLQALIEECNSFTEELQDDIDSGDYGAGAMQSRANKASDMLGKLSRYEELLGTNLDDIRGQMEEQKANAVTAALVAGGA